jgi:hypothetical protein
MANYKAVHSITVTDADGHASTCSFSVGALGDTTTVAQLATSNAAINTVLAPLTNGKVTRRSVSILLDEAQGVGTDAAYPDIEQKAVLTFANAKGSKALFHIPAPVAAIFQAPPVADIVDLTNADVAAFLAAYEGQARDAGANPYNLCLGGSLSSRRRARLISIRATTATP